MPCEDRVVVEKINKIIAAVRVKAIIKQPFFAMPLMRLRTVVLSPEECKEAKDEAGRLVRFPISSLATDGESLFVNPDGFLAIKLPEQIFIILHEVLHCILLHTVRRGNRDRPLWNIAADLVVNNVLYTMWNESEKSRKTVSVGKAPDYSINFRIPDGILYAETIQDQKVAGLSVENVYELLQRVRAKEKTHHGGDEQKAEYQMRCELRYDENGGGGGARPGGSSYIIEPKDHGNISDYEANQKAEAIAADWRKIVASATKAAMMNRGYLPGGLEYLIEAAALPIISWKRRLTKFMKNHVRVGTNWNVPSRRWLYQGLYMPSRRRPSLGRIAVVLDTSGSVDDDSIAQFLAEVRSITDVHECRLELICADVGMKYMGTYNHAKSLPKKTKIVGRGGTSFIEPFRWAERQSTGSPDMRIQMVIYLTDGCGSYPNWKVKIPTMWILNNGMSPDCPYYPPFGTVASLLD